MTIEQKTPWLGGLLSFALVLLVSASCLGQEGVLEHEKWSLMKMAGDEVGWISETLHRIEKEDGGLIYKTVLSTQMKLKRFGQGVEIASEVSTLENDKGKILEMHQKSMMSGQETAYDLIVGDNEEEASLTVTTMGTPRESTIPWDKEIVGAAGALRIQKEKGMAPGTVYSIRSFSFDYGKPFTSTSEFKEKEVVEMLDGEKGEFNHAVVTMDIMPGLKTHTWIDDDFNVEKTSLNMMGIQMESFLTTKERALRGKGAELNADMIVETMAKSNVNLPSPYRLDSILYRFKAKNPEVGLPRNLDDIRQKVVEREGDSIKVLIKAVVPEKSQTRPLGNPPPELFEYLEPNAFLQCDHPGLAKKALEVVGGETDAWKAACRLEKFVFEYIKDKNFGTGFASAAEVFENPCGDCSEHGVLLAALCRAVGIPARVAMGYMYLGGIFGGHMWAEVWINGDWYPIDGVMGIGRVDPTHITFCTSSLKDSGIGESFVSAVQGLGNLEITILEFTRGDETIKVGEEFKDYVIKGDTYTNTLYGISITKPENYEFKEYERDFSGPDFLLVKMEGPSDADLKALPAAFSFTMEKFKEKMTRDSVEILSELPRKVQGHLATVFTIENKNKVSRVLALITEDTCYTLSMRIDKANEDRDMTAFENMVKSVKFE